MHFVKKNAWCLSSLRFPSLSSRNTYQTDIREIGKINKIKGGEEGKRKRKKRKKKKEKESINRKASSRIVSS